MNINNPDTLIGKHIIIGLTILDSHDTLVESTQLHGNISNISLDGIYIKLNNTDEEYILPPDLSAIEIAPPGEYRFKSTGEVVVNPDLMTSWTIRQPDREEEENVYLESKY